MRGPSLCEICKMCRLKDFNCTDTCAMQLIYLHSQIKLMFCRHCTLHNIFSKLFISYIRTYICDHLWENRSSPRITEIHFLLVQERYIHVLSRNTNCLTIDGQVCFYRRLFTDAVKPRGCISWSWGTLIGLHGVPNCSSRQSWPSLWIVSVHVTY